MDSAPGRHVFVAARSRLSGRRGLLGAGLALLSTGLPGCSARQSPSSGSAVGLARSRPVDFSAQVSAIRRADRDAYVAAAPGSSSSAAVYAALIACRPSDYRVIGGSPRIEVLTLDLPGPDVVAQDLGFDVTAFGGGSAFWRTWPGVVRTETRHVLVLAARAPAAGALAAVDRSLEAAARVLGHPVPPLVVLVPPDAAGFTSLTGLRGDLAAACTLLPRPAQTPIARHRPVIVIGPSLPAGEQALLSVLTHEAAHALLVLDALHAGAVGDEAPAWLREGMAEWLAVRAWRQQRAVARQIERTPAVTANPGSLPVPADFAAGGQRRETAYLRAYLAVDRLARRVGVAQLLRRYRRAATSVR
jgi:hypothetical protein